MATNKSDPHSAFLKAVRLKRMMAEGDKVVAERFRTKTCRHFEETGRCPYEGRCMFAHGQPELRTKEMNLRDGLSSEDAIRNFKRHFGNDSTKKVESQSLSVGGCVTPAIQPRLTIQPVTNTTADNILQAGEHTGEAAEHTIHGGSWFRHDPYCRDGSLRALVPSRLG